MTLISKAPFSSKPQIPQEPRLKGRKPQKGSLHFSVSKPLGNELSSYHVVVVVSIWEGTHMMGVKDPNSFEQS
jgi:hypothetical protein